jgi:hypothetical protein
MAMVDTIKGYSKAERENLIHAKQDIELFLQLASMRIEEYPQSLPFKPVHGQQIISWLRYLAGKYGRGEDISW